MKRYIIYISILLTACFASSCYKDKSTYNELTGQITVDFNSPDIYEQKLGNFMEQSLDIVNSTPLTLSPIVTKEGDADPDLSYLWELTITPNSFETIFSILGETKDIDWVMTRSPNSLPYTLRYTVTDNATGVAYISKLKIMVLSSAGYGVVVADTRDGATGDLTYIRNKHISYGYTGETFYKRDAYSMANETKYNGVITDMLYGEIGQYGNFKYNIFAMSDDNLESLSSETYSIDKDLNSLFIAVPSGGKFQALRISNIIFLAIYENDLYGSTTKPVTGSQILFNDPINYISPDKIANKRFVNRYFGFGPSTMISFLDETNGQMYWYNFSSLGYPCTEVEQGSGPYAYDPGKFAGYELLGACRGPDFLTESGGVRSESFLIAKSPEGDINIYGSRDDFDDAWHYYTTREVATTACPEIAQATAFEGCVSRDVIYYSTDTEVYNCVVGANAASASVAFTAPANEQVTCMKIYHDAWYNQATDPADGEVKTPMHDNMLLVATYNPSTGEGTLRAMPISGASGALTTADADHTFTGFGKITAIAIQGKQ